MGDVNTNYGVRGPLLLEEVEQELDANGKTGGLKFLRSTEDY